MKRKVIEQGNGTLTITLPKKWTEKQSLKGGDEIDVSVEGPTMIVKAEGEIPAKSISISLDEKQYSPVASHPNMIRTIVGNMYKKGYDEIEIRFAEPKMIKYVQERANMLMGMEIIRSYEKSCVIKQLLKEDPAEFDSMLRKFFLMVLDYSKELYENKVQQENIDNFRLSIEKLNDFLERLIAKNLSQNASDLRQLSIITRTIEKTTREYIHLSNYMIDNDVKLSKTTKDLLKEANEMFRTFYEHYYKFDLADSYKQANKKNKLLHLKGAESLMNAPKKEIPVVHHLLNIIRRIWDMEGPLISLRLG